ncbi:MAG: FkbM family methyltransferase [Opitutales bacterium]
MFEGTRLILRGRKTARRTDVEEIAILRKRISAGDAVFDVGANKGGYLASLARMVGRRGRVFAFEPLPELAARLETACARLRWRQVEVCSAAASDEDGTAVLATPAGNRHWESSLEGNASLGARTPDVPTRRLDNYLDQLEGRPLTAMKIDVEGHESAVIAGGSELITRNKPMLLVEVEAQHRPDRDPGVFFSQMGELGYRGWFLREGVRQDMDAFEVKRDQAGNGQHVNNFVFEPI